ncbi:type IX secretion system membrane protein PorP/SprF [bacterium]|nr:type IX secretion system membrane protein PorP/SprF [bacterium]
MKRMAILVSVLMILATRVSSQEFVGARPIGLGGAYVGLADDANATVWNPGGVAFLPQREATGMYSRLYWGIDDDNIGVGFFSYVNPVQKVGTFGLTWQNLSSRIYTENRFSLTYARSFTVSGFALGLGLNTNLLMSGYNKSRFVPNPDEPVDIANEELFKNTSKIGVSFDIGGKLVLNDRLSVGLLLSDLNQPDISLEGYSNGAKPFTGRIGVAYNYRDFLYPVLDFQFINDEVNGGNIFSPHLGVEAWFSEKMFAIRGGADERELSFGASYRFQSKWGFQVDYAFVYPLSEMRKVSQTHKFSATVRVPNVYRYDLVLEKLETSKSELKKGEKFTISFSSANRSLYDISNIPLTLYYRDPSGSYYPLEKKSYPDFLSGESKAEEKEVSFDEPGNYVIFAAIDDDGTAIPTINGHIDEKKESNNIDSVSVRVFAPPKGTIVSEKNFLRLEEVQTVRVEVPRLPFVFFDEGKHEIDDKRFEPLFDLIVDRLARNPDVVIKIRGFYSPETDGEDKEPLADLRAKAVYDKLIDLGVPKDQLELVDGGYDKSKKRAGEGIFLEKDREEIFEENRRVEMETSIRGLTPDEARFVVPFPANAKRTAAKISPIPSKWINILERNPDVLILVDGKTGKSEKESARLSFQRADFVRSSIIESVPERFRDRVSIYNTVGEHPQTGCVTVSLLADGLLYRPDKGRLTPVSYVVEDSLNRFHVSILSDARVTRSIVTVEDESGQIVKHIEEKDGIPDTVIVWNWRNDAGEIIDPSKKFFGHLHIEDELGQEYDAYSDTISVEIIHRVREMESMPLVLFDFNTDLPISPYYETRTEELVNNILKKMDTGYKSMVILVEGHTDIIGMESRNKALSSDRARREEENIRLHLSKKVGIPVGWRLEDWLKKHNISLKSQGVGPSVPYEIETEEGKRLIGENDFPEGRMVNRRVMVRIEVTGED